MVQKMKDIKLNVTMSALLTVIMGVVLIIWPGETVTVFSRIFSCILILAGAGLLITSLVSFRPALIGALLLLAVGLWSLANPRALTSILPVAAGIIMITHGVQDLAMLPALRRYKADRWGSTLLFGLISIVFGAVCVCKAFGIVKLVMVVIGLMLIYDGVSDMVIVRKHNYFRKQYTPPEEADSHMMIDAQGKEFLEESAIDADFREVDDE